MYLKSGTYSDRRTAKDEKGRLEIDAGRHRKEESRAKQTNVSIEKISRPTGTKQHESEKQKDREVE